MNVQTLKKAVKSVSDIMTANKDYLVQLDQQNGDGDLGISMAAGFKAVSDYLSASGEEKDLGRLLMKCGAVFNEKAPSSLGTILSMGMMGMAKALKGREEADTASLAAAMEAGIASIMEKAKSKPGEKTVLDALCPGIEALKRHSGEAPPAAWTEAAGAAAAGSESTRNMRSVHGRAAYYGDKSVGILDGGSVVGKLIFEGVAASLRE
ncbi:MAG: dihydroxyacetone kinase subunit L [Treponema sp.]|jgi:dihydroxyacetone kinase|nr:dihydroxyacetone kinase subunit L [Treponema sp.]